MYYATAEQATQIMRELSPDEPVFMAIFTNVEVYQAARIAGVEMTDELKEKVWDAIQSADYITDVDDIANFINEIQQEEIEKFWADGDCKTWISADKKRIIRRESLNAFAMYELNCGHELFIQRFSYLPEAKRGYFPACNKIA